MQEGRENERNGQLPAAIVTATATATAVSNSRSSSSSSRSSVGVVPSSSASYDAIIIGAGWSGVSAAKTLMNNGYENILVLEARDRIGGRSHTVTDFFDPATDASDSNNNNNHHLDDDDAIDDVESEDAEEGKHEQEREQKRVVEFEYTQGSRVRGNFCATKFHGRREEKWYEGTIRKVHHHKHDDTTTTTATYDIDYDDGDKEEHMTPRNIRPLTISHIPVELGSEYIYTDPLETNEIVDLFARHQIPSTFINFLDKKYTALFTDLTENNMMDGARTDQLNTRLWDGFMSYIQTQQDDDDDDDVDYDQLLCQYKTQENITDAFDVQYLNMLVTSKLVNEYAADPTTLSVISTRDDILEGGCFNTTLSHTGVPNGGFGVAMKKLIQEAGIQDQIKTSSIVQSIDYITTDNNNQTEVVVTYCTNNNKAVVDDDDDGLITVKAPMVLVTVPLGVLKSGMIQFTPILPKYKREAIATMQMGLLNKYLVYWDDETMAAPTSHTFRQRWESLMDRNCLDLVTTTPTDPSSNLFPFFFNSRKHNGGKFVLRAWIGGAMAAAMEHLEDEEILVRYILPNLRTIFGTDEIPLPTKSLMTRWGQDPYSQGSYSYPSVHVDSPAVATALGRTIDDTLFFAGEHTCDDWSDWSATTVGAYKSGVTAATRMAEVLRNGHPYQCQKEEDRQRACAA